jgi:hypothetical protein
VKLGSYAEFLSRMFIGSHSLPPSLVRRSGPSSGIRAGYGSLLTLTSLRSKDGIPGMRIGSSALRWKELPDVAEVDGSVPPRKGSDPLGRYGEHILCSSN